MVSSKCIYIYTYIHTCILLQTDFHHLDHPHRTHCAPGAVLIYPIIYGRYIHTVELYSWPSTRSPVVAKSVPQNGRRVSRCRCMYVQYVAARQCNELISVLLDKINPVSLSFFFVLGFVSSFENPPSCQHPSPVKNSRLKS
jgi:hypothetical protein